MKISILQVTKDCNQDCFYCTRDRSIKEEGISIINEKIDSLDDNITQVIITGGEPTLRSDLCQIIKLAKGKSQKVHLQSNGINLSNFDLCNRLVESGVNSILIALPSIDNKVCEAITHTKGVLKKKIKALHNLSKFKDIELGVVFVVNRKNYKELPKYVKFISSISRDIYIQITYMIRYLPDHKNMRHFVVRFTDFKPYLDEALKICEAKNMQFRLDGLPLCFVRNHIKNVSDLKTRKYHFIEDFIDIDRDEYDSDNYVGKEHVKGKECNNCELNGICKGVYTYYSKMFGTSELSFVKDGK